MATESGGMDLNGAFGGGEVSIDTGAADEMQNQEVEVSAEPEQESQEAAPEPEAPAVEGQEQPNVESKPVPPPVASQPSSSTAPPQEPPPWYEKTMAPINQYFKQQQEILKLGLEQRQKAQEMQAREAAKKARLEARAAAMPKAPDPASVTVAEFTKYQSDYALWAARAEAEDREIALREEIGALKSTMEQIVDYNREQALEAQSRVNQAYIQQAVDAYAADPRFPWMKTQEGRDLFLGQWWSLNQAAGRTVEPGEAMARIVGMISAVTGQKTQVATARAAQTTLDQARREEQNKAGVPAAPKAGAPSNKPNNSGGSLDPNWWESGALAMGR